MFLVARAVLSQAEAGPALDGQLAITEQQAIALFYQRNLSLIAASLNIDEARAQEIIAAAIPNPVFSLTISELNSKMSQAENRDQPLPAVLPQIQQPIETAGKRQLRIESSELATEAVNFDLQDVVRTLTNAVRRSYYSLILAQKALKPHQPREQHAPRRHQM